MSTKRIGILAVSGALLLLTNCGESPKIMSNEHCYITYSPSQQKLAKIIYQEAQMDLTGSDKQLQFEILDEGDVVNVKYELGTNEAKNRQYCEIVTGYCQREYIKKPAVFQFTQGPSKVLFTIKSEETPVDYSYINANFLCDIEVSKADQAKIKKAVAAKKVPQETSYWLKKENGKYTCYYISNTHWQDEWEVKQASMASREMMLMVRELKLSQPAATGFMDIDYNILE